jgi:hypothetical protein
MTSSMCAIDSGMWLHFRRLPDSEQRQALFNEARLNNTPAARRKNFVVGCLCTLDGQPLQLPEVEVQKLDKMTLSEWDEAIAKCAHLNGFAVLQVIAD